jgi:flavin-dependent dehydrogenase
MFHKKSKVGIIGGGPAGLSIAIALRRKKFEVILFEADQYKRPRTGEHLAAEALHEFKKLEIPESILVNHSIACQEVQSAWGQTEVQSNESIFNPFGDGYILSRPDFDEALFKYSESLGVRAIKGVRVQKAVSDGDKWELQTKEQNYSVDFLVDASGRNTKFKLSEGGQKIAKDQLIGISRTISADQPSTVKSTFLLIEAIPSGWWYSVELPSSNMILTFMTDANALSGNNISPEQLWEEQMLKSTHTKNRIGKREITGITLVQSAQSQLLSKPVGKNCLAVGDAAQSYDPLSSAGIIKGLKAGQLAADKIDDFFRGNKKALSAYEAELEKQFEEYLLQKEMYYSQERRWLNQPFWYRRNLKVKLIQQFTIHPQYEMNVIDESSQEKLFFLQEQIVETDFKLLLQCVKEYSIAQKVIKAYLARQQEDQMHPYLIHSLESLKLIGIVR